MYLLLQVKQEMQQGGRRPLALPHSEQEGCDAAGAVFDTKVSSAEVAVAAGGSFSEPLFSGPAASCVLVPSPEHCVGDHDAAEVQAVKDRMRGSCFQVQLHREVL